MADNRKLSALPAASGLGADDLMYVVREGLSARASLGQFVTFAAATMQPAAANLTALSGLEALAGRLPYFTGAGAMATTPTTAFGRGLLNLADAAATRALVSLDAVDNTRDANKPISGAALSALALKADKTVAIGGVGLVTGGGDLSASRTLSVAEASEAEALAGAASDKAMTPRRTRAVVDGAVALLQEDIDDLAAGQATNAVTAESWTVLAGYPTGSRTQGDPAKVIGADAGTHTDPVVGGTVDNRGIYRWSASPAGWKRVADLDADAAAASAAEAAAAVEAVLPPTDYNNPGGTGDRTGIIKVTASAGIYSIGFIKNLVNGSTTSNSDGSIAFTDGDAAGSYLRFDFGPGAAQRITEARWRQGTTHTHGTWKWRGSDNLTDYTDIGATFVLGGATAQLQTELASNNQGYRYYELVGVSGTRSIHPYIHEIEFKVAPAPFDQRLLVSTGGNPGEVLTKISNLSGEYEFRPARRVCPMPTNGLVAEWYFDEGQGDRVRNIRNADPTYDIVFDSAFRTTYATSPQWTRKGLLLEGDMVQSGILPGIRTVATLYRLKRGAAGTIVAGGAGASFGVLGSTVPLSYEYWVSTSSGVAPLLYDSATGGSAHKLNRGGWVLLFTEFDSNYNTAIGWGGTHSSAGAAYRAEELEVAWSAAWNVQLSDDDREAVFLGVRRLAGERDIYLHWRDCPDYYDCVLFWGQSGITGFSLISDLSALDQARTSPTSSVLVSLAPNGYGPLLGSWPMPEPFQFRYNHTNHGAMGTFMGPLPGAAWAHEDNRANRQRKLVIDVTAIESTSLSITYSPAETWNAGTSVGSGLLWKAMRHWWDTERYLLNQGIGCRLRALWYFQGEEDSIDDVQSSAYGANIADMWDATKLYLAPPPGFTMKLVKTPLLTPLAGFDVDANAEVRDAQVAFAGATADVDLVVGDDLPQQNDGSFPNDEHWTGQSIKVIGERLYAATDLS